MPEGNSSSGITDGGDDNAITQNHPYHLHPLDSPGMCLVNTVFDGKGFPGWRRSVLIALSWICYKSLIVAIFPECLLHLILTHTRPDLAFAVLKLSQFMQRPSLSHFSAALRVIRYLQLDPGQGILLSAHPSFSLLAFCDADWASCPDSRRSVSVFYITFGGSPISWKSKKQVSISLSSAEAEYRSMRKVTAELTWLIRLFADFSISPSLPVPIYSDNQAAIHIARNPVFHERTKHVELDCHFVRQQYLSGMISLFFVPSEQQIADLFTKPLNGGSHRNIMRKLRFLSLPSNLRGDVDNHNSTSTSLDFPIPMAASIKCPFGLAYSLKLFAAYKLKKNKLG